MKIKTKYNIGDYVAYYSYGNKDYVVVIIQGVNISFSNAFGLKVTYRVSPPSFDCVYDHSYEINENDIRKVVNKKAFEKELAKRYVRQLAEKEVEND